MSVLSNPIPFRQNHQLVTNLPDLQSASAESNLRLPGHPGRHLSDPGLARFLLGDVGTSELDAAAPHLWMLATYSYANINPLHAQQIRGRSIVPAEHPRLHMTWKHSQVFIKPLPRYLLSYTFWHHYLVDTASPLPKADREAIVRAAKGLLRTYYHLIRHETDFELAQSCRLLPRDITWSQFSEFISEIPRISNSEVSPRYHYGEIRLSRLNFYAPFLFRRLRYEWGWPHYGIFFSRFYGHLLFVWAAFSLLLDALQVELAVESLVQDQWVGMWYMSRYFSVICFATIGTTIIVVFATLIAIILREWIYAIRVVKSVRKSSIP